MGQRGHPEALRCPKKRLPRLLLLALVAAGGCQGLPSSRLYGYGEGWLDQRLPAADEVASAEFHLRTPVVFYGQRYKSLFVSTALTLFNSELDNFFNTFESLQVCPI